MKHFIAAFLLLMISTNSISQSTLPDFSVQQIAADKVQVSWRNPYNGCVQLAIQRSYDSIRFFKTIFSPQSPELPQNGYIDQTAAPGVKVFYRIFYVLEGGQYFFTISKRPGINEKTTQKEIVLKQESANPKKLTKQPDEMNAEQEEVEPVVIKPIHWVSIFKKTKDSLVTKLDFDYFKKYKDSIRLKTKDTLAAIGMDEYLIHPFVPKIVWKPSSYLYTNENGYILLKIPTFAIHQYSVLFMEENGTEIYKINHIKDDYLMIDKSNFPHAGWFFFILYEDGKALEKNKFYVESDLQ